jgi:hypothetical protein
MVALVKKKHVTGFCNSINKQPQHEGTKPVSPSGVSLPICTFWDTCGCSCHEQITKMYTDIGVEREPPEQSHDFLVKVRAEYDEFDLTGSFLDGDMRPLSNDGGTIPHPDPSGPHNGPPSAQDGHVSTLVSLVPARPVFTATPTGRRARGQLEYDVLQVCNEFVQSVWDWSACTSKVVAERIGKMNATEPPSTGAINAVWDRWEKMGFAEQAKKPLRFARFTGESSAAVLDRRKLQIKRSRKRTQAEIKRGAPRPKRR